MNPEFPNLPQLTQAFCFLSPYEYHQHLVHSLDAQVYLATTPGSQLPPLEELVALLRIRYGGSSRHWFQTKVIGGALLTTPPWLRPDDLIEDSGYWETGWGLQMLPWQCIDSPAVLPIFNRVQITIHDFPIEFWHLHYLQQATAAMGTIAGFDPRHRACRDKEGATLLLDCPDTNLIPRLLHIGHPNGHWSRCKVVINGRAPLSQQANPPLNPPPPDLEGDQTPTAPSMLGANVPPTITFWRSRNSTARHPVREPHRSPAPAANHWAYPSYWATKRPH